MDAIEEEESSDDGQESTTPSCSHSMVDLASYCLTLAPALSARCLANADNLILRTQIIPSPITSVTLQVIATLLPVSPCLTLFETEEALRDHICISHKAMLPVARETNFHQFEDGPLIMIRNISFEWPQPHSQIWSLVQLGRTYLHTHALRSLPIIFHPVTTTVRLNLVASMCHQTTQSWSAGTATAPSSTRTISSRIKWR